MAGRFLTLVDKKDGRRVYGCLMDEAGGCLCCSPGGVLEFCPKKHYVWPTNFPPAQSKVVVCGTLKMIEEGTDEQSVSIPKLMEADIKAKWPHGTEVSAPGIRLPCTWVSTHL